MNWFKTILLLGVLGMTWAECDRRPAAQSHAWPEAAFEPSTTNAALGPVSGEASTAPSVSALARPPHRPDAAGFPLP